MKFLIVSTLLSRATAYITDGPETGMFFVAKERRGLRSEGDNGNVASCSHDEISRKLFGGEDLLNGDPWWHEFLSERAGEEYGLSSTAADMIAWHADYTDSYAYNPLYWFGTINFIKRFKAAKSIGPDLVKVHNDDLFAPFQVINAQYRYMTGCLVGLHWAAQVDKGAWLENVDAVGVAHNILGVTFHALQDFYSHSNWIDEPSRRDKTFLDIPRCDLENKFLYTGAYEEEGGIKSHGIFSILCSIAGGGNDVSNSLKFVLDLYCGQQISLQPNWHNHPEQVQGVIGKEYGEA